MAYQNLQPSEPSEPSDEMLRRMMQQQYLQEQRRIILQQPAEQCPRCDSLDTKFAYFNNIKESQPRYLCKGCRRLWTKGGKLRDVRVRPARLAKPARPLISQSCFRSSAGRSHFSNGPNGPRFQAPAYNIQPAPNAFANVLNPFRAAWEGPNQGLRQLQPSDIDWSAHFPVNGPLN